MEFLGGYGSKGLLADRLGVTALVLVAAATALGLIYYVFFRNWREELEARRFFQLLEAQEYERAYGMWGCSVEEPCRYYPFGEFLEDWGRESPFGVVAEFTLGRSYTQPNGVILRYTVNGIEGAPLWIEHGDRRIGFAPN